MASSERARGIYLNPPAYLSLPDNDAVAVLLHESFHSFNCVNDGPDGALNEGAAIWIPKTALFAETLL
jgi:hypothetical protein